MVDRGHPGRSFPVEHGLALLLRPVALLAGGEASGLPRGDLRWRERYGRPPTRPRPRAAATGARVRSRMISRSKLRQRAEDVERPLAVVSMFSFRDLNPIARAWRSSTSSIRSMTEEPDLRARPSPEQRRGQRANRPSGSNGTEKNVLSAQSGAGARRRRPQEHEQCRSGTRSRRTLRFLDSAASRRQLELDLSGCLEGCARASAFGHAVLARSPWIDGLALCRLHLLGVMVM
jgi:hypothetical protein